MLYASPLVSECSLIINPNLVAQQNSIMEGQRSGELPSPRSSLSHTSSINSEGQRSSLSPTSSRPLLLPSLSVTDDNDMETRIHLSAVSHLVALFTAVTYHLDSTIGCVMFQKQPISITVN